MRKFYLFLLFVSLLCTQMIGSWSTVLGQSEARSVTPDDVNRVASELWCPLCSGVRLDACELKACEQMREEIAIKLEAGDDLPAIKQYFLERYGEQVLGAPQRKGWGWLAWLLPPIVVTLAGVLLFVRGRAMIKLPAALPAKPATNQQAVDRYEAKLDEELTRYE